MYIFYPRFGERLLASISLLCIMLMPIGFWMTHAEALHLIVFIIIAVLASPFGISYIIMLFSRKPGLVIDDRGITVNMGLFWRNHFFPWHIIGGVRVGTDEVHSRRVTVHRVLLYIHPKHPNMFPKRSKRKWVQWGRLELPCTYAFGQKGLDADAIRAAIKANGKLRER